VAVKKSTISGNNGALEHPYSRRWAVSGSPRLATSKHTQLRSVAADLPATWNQLGYVQVPRAMRRGISIKPMSPSGHERRDKDSDKRQRAAIASFAKTHGYRIVDEFYDAAVSGADPVAERPGFKAMLERIAGNGVRVILVERPDRFARDLSVQITGHDYLRSLGVELVPTSAPDFFTTDTPTAV
jgi:hypothetical protein